jgi:hypothetical protein
VLKCTPDEVNPRGPCVPCQQSITISRLPCLRYLISDSILFRTSIANYDFYRHHHMVGKTYGDFHIAKLWTGQPTKILEFTQDRGPICKMEVREFFPPDEHALDTRGNPIYAVPWAIADPDALTRSLNEYLDESMGCYLDEILDDSDRLVWNVFHSALRLSLFPEPVSKPRLPIAAADKCSRIRYFQMSCGCGPPVASWKENGGVVEWITSKVKPSRTPTAPRTGYPSRRTLTTSSPQLLCIEYWDRLEKACSKRFTTWFTQTRLPIGIRSS